MVLRCTRWNHGCVCESYLPACTVSATVVFVRCVQGRGYGATHPPRRNTSAAHMMSSSARHRRSLPPLLATSAMTVLPWATKGLTKVLLHEFPRLRYSHMQERFVCTLHLHVSVSSLNTSQIYRFHLVYSPSLCPLWVMDTRT